MDTSLPDGRLVTCGKERRPEDGSRRYRIFQFSFDTRAAVLDTVIQPDWDPEIQEQWRNNQAGVISGLEAEFGRHDLTRKVEDFKALGSMPLSVLAYHNRFLRQIRNAFVLGSYYPALLGAVALGERILNYLALALRAEFSATPEYAKVWKKQSFDNWGLVIDTLQAWGIFDDSVAAQWRTLREQRNSSVHFKPEVQTNDRELAIQAITTLQSIVAQQFGAFGPLRWFIPDTAGQSFVKREVEGNQFVKLVYLPNSVLVGGDFSMYHTEDGTSVAFDRTPDSMVQMTDDEFVSSLTDR